MESSNQTHNRQWHSRTGPLGSTQFHSDKEEACLIDTVCFQLRQCCNAELHSGNQHIPSTHASR